MEKAEQRNAGYKLTRGQFEPDFKRCAEKMMEYQLVIQIEAESVGDFDSLIELEDSLSRGLGDSADVDGHDFGSGEANIFIMTPDPTGTFSILKERLESRGILARCKVAHREVDGEEYTVLWPENSTETFTVQ